MITRRITLAIALALVLPACPAAVQETLDEGPDPVVEEFVAAWNEEDFEAIDDLLLDSPAMSHWHPGALRVYWQKVLRQGQITDHEISLVGIEETDEGSPAPYDVEYSITYRSEASPDAVTFSGALPVRQKDGDWGVAWSRHVAWPGLDRARGFRILQSWLPRGRIKDRAGRTLASGREAERSYPFGSTGGTTVGHLEPASKKTVFDRLVGGSGLEEAFDEHLAGEPTQRLAVVAGQKVLERSAPVRGKKGKNLKTTLDGRVQQAAEGAFGGTIGGAVVLDPRSGDILAAVDSSAFDPGNYVGASNVEPFNRALSGLYPPGSSLKVMTASAALDTGEVKTSTILTGPSEYRGVRNFESGEFGSIDFGTALKFSVNTAFAQVALRLGSKKLHRYAGRFGFNRPPRMALQAGSSSFPKPLDEGDLMWGSIGQAQVLATPLQMATVAATVANDGKRMEPRIDMGVAPRGRRAIDVKTARTMKELMRNVVLGGTGVAANVSGLEVAGKTGTAEVDVAGERKNHAWFICFAPASDPKVAVAVVSEYGGVGGQVAAPLARSILTSVWPHLR